jgi:small ligand-binding sensory domain FIST
MVREAAAMIRFAEGLSTREDSDAAIEEVVSKLEASLAGSEGDLAFLFSTLHHAEALGRAAQALTERGLGRVVLGCTCESVVGEGREIEGTAGLVGWSAHLPGVDLEAFAISGAEDPPVRPADTPELAVLLLGDPFSFPTDDWLQRFEAGHPGIAVAGGMASGGNTPGQNRLVLGGEVRTAGAVGVSLRGNLSIRTVVSQGCRPIGRPLIVTKAEQNIVRELGRRPALEVFQEIFQALPEDDQERVRDGLHLGRVINEYQESFGAGDFLVRNVMGTDGDGGIAVGDLVRVGQTVQFHVRDASTADEDLNQRLARASETGPAAAGALLFTCNGRGSRLFPGPDHDVGVLRERLGPIPAAGFFAMGEVGPVGGRNFVHGFTASVVLFGDR